MTTDTTSDIAADDAKLVAAARKGDTVAFGQLVLRYQDQLVNVVGRFLGSQSDAPDVVQDAFVQAFTKLDSFRGDSKFYTWLYRIAFNLAMSKARSRRPVQSLDQGKDGFGNEPMDQSPTPDASMAQQERACLVHAALQKLDEQHRQVVVLRELEGCAYSEIAEILEVPVGTVRSRLFRARLELRNHLAPVLGEELK